MRGRDDIKETHVGKAETTEADEEAAQGGQGMIEEKLRVQKLRSELLKLGQPIIIPAREQTIKNADDAPPLDITVYPIFV